MLVSFNGGDLYANPAQVEAVDVEFTHENGVIVRYVNVQINGHIRHMKINEPTSPHTVAQQFVERVNEALKAEKRPTLLAELRAA